MDIGSEYAHRIIENELALVTMLFFVEFTGTFKSNRPILNHLKIIQALYFVFERLILPRALKPICLTCFGYILYIPGTPLR